MPDTEKTKAELLREIDELESQLRHAEEKEAITQPAKKLHDLYESFIKVGFTEQQAWVLTLAVVNNQNK